MPTWSDFLLLGLKAKAPTDNHPHNACCQYNPQDSGAMLIKRRDIPLWRVLYDSVAILRHNDRVAPYRLFAFRLSPLAVYVYLYMFEYAP